METKRKNVLQMILDAEASLDAGLRDDPLAYPVVLRRESWEHPKAAFLVIDTFPEPREWAAMKPPYFNGPAWAKPHVYGVMHDGRTGRYSLDWLRCPSNFSYHRIALPDWWNPPDVRCRLDLRGADNQRWPGDFWVECSLREGMNDDEEDIDQALDESLQAQRIVVPGVTGRA